MAPPWPLTSSHLTTARLLLAGPFQLFFAFYTFLYLSFLNFSFFFPHCLLFRLCLYVRKANRQQLITPEYDFFQLRLTLSPVTGRRPDDTIFSVDIGTTDVTENSPLFAVTSTTCSTLLKQVVAVFSPPIDIKQALLIVQHTQSVSVPIRHPSDKSSVLSQASSRQTYTVYTSQIQDTRYIRCLLYTSPSPRDKRQSRMPSSA